MPYFYHYTDEKGAKNIVRTGRIMASLKFVAKGDVAHGNGASYGLTRSLSSSLRQANRLVPPVEGEGIASARDARGDPVSVFCPHVAHPS